MSEEYYYHVSVEVLITAGNPHLKDQITGEINTFCHELEELGGCIHIYLSHHDVKLEGPEPRTAAGSLD